MPQSFGGGVARVFLERVGDNVIREEAYRDIIQRVLYGRSLFKFSILCEDEEADRYARFFGMTADDLRRGEAQRRTETGRGSFSTLQDRYGTAIGRG